MRNLQKHSPRRPRDPRFFDSENQISLGYLRSVKRRTNFREKYRRTKSSKQKSNRSGNGPIKLRDWRQNNWRNFVTAELRTGWEQADTVTMKKGTLLLRFAVLVKMVRQAHHPEQSRRIGGSPMGTKWGAGEKSILLSPPSNQ